MLARSIHRHLKQGMQENAAMRTTRQLLRAYSEEANFCGQAGKAVAEVVDVLAVVQSEPRQMLCLESPLVVEEV